MAPNSVRSLEVGSSKRFDTVTNNASTIAELISTIPQSWRATLGAYLTNIYRVATKLTNVQNTVAQYERHIADGSSFPAPIRNSIKDPKIQYSKEYLGTSEGAAIKATMETKIKTAQKALLIWALEKKKEELATLQGLVKWDKKAWRKDVGEVATRVATVHSVTAKVDTELPKVDWGTGTPAQLVLDCQGLWDYGDLYHYRALAIARSLADRALIEKTKNLKIKADTDVAMKDADSEKPTIELIRDENRALKAELKLELSRMMNKSRSPAKGKNKKQKGGPNPNRVKKGKPQKKGQTKKRKL